MRPPFPTPVMTWARLPAATRRRLAVLLGHLARHRLAPPPLLEDLGHDRGPSGEEGYDDPFGEGAGTPPGSLGASLCSAIDAASGRAAPGVDPAAVRAG